MIISMTVQDDIIRFLKVTGPTIPSKVAKQVKTEILFASAHLSDLASQKKVKISSLKIGGTPLYYLPGQEDQLYHFAPGNLNPKDFDVLEHLRNSKVLRESGLDLLSKVALRGLKDFAVPINVTTAEKTELFWRWHLLNADDTNLGISAILRASSTQGMVETEIPVEEVSKLGPGAGVSDGPTVRNSEDVTTDAILPVVGVSQMTLIDAVADKAAEKSVIEPTLAKKKSKVTGESKIRVKEKDAEKVFEKPTLPSLLEDSAVSVTPEAKPVIVQSEFGLTMESYFSALKIEAVEAEAVRKNEINYVVKVPSAVGHIRYHAKAKQKIKTDERDLAAAYLEAQMKKMPLLYLYTGELTKKAQEMVAMGAYENMALKRVE